MLIFIAVMVFTTAFYLYTRRHGSIDTAAGDIGISAGQAILIDGDTGKVLYEKAADEKAYPASTTKIMTALITIETLKKYGSPPEQLVEVPAQAEGVEGSSLYLRAGEKISIEDLLYGLMLVSGNDAAVALADIIGGSVDGFVEMMNDRAAELHCANTHFVNPNGLFDENHYTSVRDMAIIARAAMQEPEFRKIAETHEWTADRKDSTYLTFRNKNKTVYEYEGGCGVKIGYTKSSGRTLVAAAEREGKLLICVVMSAPDWFNDAYRLMDYGFDTYK